MSALERLIRRYDDRRMVRHGNPSRFNIRLDELLVHYDRALADGVTAQSASDILDSLTLVFGNITWLSDKELAAVIYPILRTEMPGWDVFVNLIPSDIAILRKGKKTKMSMGHLRVRAALSIAILSNELGMFGRLFDERLASAKEHYAFASRWLKSAYEEEHPQHAEIVVYDAPRPYTPIIGTPTYGGL